MSQGRENSSCSTTVRLHGTSYHCYQRHITFNLQIIRVDRSLDSCQYLLLFLLKLILMNNNTHGIDTGRNMFKGNTLFFKLFQNLTAKTNLRVHHIFFNIYRYKTFFTGNSGNGVMRFVAGACHNHGSLILRAVGIPDINRNARFTYRENRILMKYCCPHVGKFS